MQIAGCSHAGSFVRRFPSCAPAFVACPAPVLDERTPVNWLIARRSRDVASWSRTDVDVSARCAADETGCGHSRRFVPAASSLERVVPGALLWAEFPRRRAIAVRMVLGILAGAWGLRSAGVRVLDRTLRRQVVTRTVAQIAPVLLRAARAGSAGSVRHHRRCHAVAPGSWCARLATASTRGATRDSVRTDAFGVFDEYDAPMESHGCPGDQAKHVVVSSSRRCAARQPEDPDS